MTIHVNQITLSGTDRFSKQFNVCSELFMKSNNQTLSEEERTKASNEWFEERQRLELGIY